MNWNTDIWLSSNDDEYYHVLARCLWPTPEKCLYEMERVLHAFADGRKAFIRRMPAVATETDYESGITIHSGSVRFSFRTEPGEWKYPEPIDEGASFGLASLADVPSNENVL